MSTGCKQKTFDTKAELLAYLTDESNGYSMNKEVNGIKFSLMYKPTDLLVSQELGNKTPDKNTIKALRAKYGQYMYFNLSISANNKELLSVVPKDRNEFGAMVNQLAFGMGEKVHLYTKSKDTIDLLDYVYPRLYGMGRSTTMMFVYPRDKKKLEEEFINFTVEDLNLNTGELRFKIGTENINNEPEFKFII